MTDWKVVLCVCLLLPSMVLPYTGQTQGNWRYHALNFTPASDCIVMWSNVCCLMPCPLCLKPY